MPNSDEVIMRFGRRHQTLMTQFSALEQVSKTYSTSRPFPASPPLIEIRTRILHDSFNDTMTLTDLQTILLSLVNRNAPAHEWFRLHNRSALSGILLISAPFLSNQHFVHPSTISSGVQYSQTTSPNSFIFTHHNNTLTFGISHICHPHIVPSVFEKQLFVPTQNQINGLIPRIKYMQNERGKNKLVIATHRDHAPPPLRSSPTWAERIKRKTQKTPSGLTEEQQNEFLKAVLSEAEMSTNGFPFGLSLNFQTPSDTPIDQQAPVYVFLPSDWKGDPVEKQRVLETKQKQEDDFRKEMEKLINANATHFRDKAAQKQSLLQILGQPGCMSCLGDSLLDLPSQIPLQTFEVDQKELATRNEDGRVHVLIGKSSQYIHTASFFEKCLSKEEQESLQFYPLIGIDCEMVKVKPKSSFTNFLALTVAPKPEQKAEAPECLLELARVTIVDDQFEVILDCLCVPDGEVVDYLTEFSGMTKDMLYPSAQQKGEKKGEKKSGKNQPVMVSVPAGKKQTQLQLFKSRRAVRDFILRSGIIQPDTIVVGHSVENDLIALKLTHDLVIDTSVLFPHKAGPPVKNSLRFLTKNFLHYSIQTGNHDSKEDSLAALRLAFLAIKKIEVPKSGQVKTVQKENFFGLSVLDCHTTCIVNPASAKEWQLEELAKARGKPLKHQEEATKAEAKEGETEPSPPDLVEPRRGTMEVSVVTKFDDAMSAAMAGLTAQYHRQPDDPLPFMFVQLNTVVPEQPAERKEQKSKKEQPEKGKKKNKEEEPETAPDSQEHTKFVQDLDVGIELLVQGSPKNSLIVVLCGPWGKSPSDEGKGKQGGRDRSGALNDPSNKGSVMFLLKD
ncbi:putative Small RNA degrading nuclease 5 [Blattamonas nauphoetae]|uniref:Small RNA degrading nuclease 5 n=1 Tax=Blattamonas nauphoetae TaxID=2049346 RepID=A0ABQ9YEE6_9EUKA|nr:putative Small RNA degrading nuclease 5 [Blattamonas nauphoetae]